jgi:hypothetical protein
MKAFIKHSRTRTNRFFGFWSFYSLVFLMVASLSGFAQEQDDEPYMVKNFGSAKIQQVKAETSGGSIRVESTTGESRVEVFIKPNNSSDWGRKFDKEEIEDRLKDYELIITQAGTDLSVVARPKDRSGYNWKRGLSIAFRIFVPEKVATVLRTSGGSISLKNVTGNQDFKTSGGSISLKNVGGSLKGHTSGGSLNLSRCRDLVDVSTSGGSITVIDSEGEITLSTSGGSLTLENLNGKISARTSGGSISAEDIKGELTASTSGGSVRMAGLACALDVSTSAGSVDLKIVELNKYVRINATAGSVSVKMPFEKGMDLDLRAMTRVEVSGWKNTNFNGTWNKDEVYGKLNGGGIPVKIRASTGNIYLKNF